MNADLQQQLAAERLHMAALDRSMARVEFDPDGNITDANENFLTCWATAATRSSANRIASFATAPTRNRKTTGAWERLRRGEHFSGRCSALPARAGHSGWKPPTTPYATGRVDC